MSQTARERLREADTIEAFRAVLVAELEGLVSPHTKDHVRRALDQSEVLRSVFGAHRVEPATEPSWFDAAFSRAWYAQAETFLRDPKRSHAVWALERALELQPDFALATERLAAVNRERDAAQWIVMRHDAYAREDSLVAEFPSRAAAEARVRELNAAGEVHHWAAPST
jgi:hypothetical protein